MGLLRMEKGGFQQAVDEAIAFRRLRSVAVVASGYVVSSRNEISNSVTNSIPALSQVKVLPQGQTGAFLAPMSI